MVYKTVSSQQLSRLPTQPGVYIFRDKENKAIYIGKAKSLRSRVRSYFQKSKRSLKTEQMIRRIKTLETMVVGSETEALILEANLIKEYRPYFNVRMRDDKTYPYIRVTVEESFPRVTVTRKVEGDGSKYFGPYTSIGQMREALSVIKKLYTVRSCHYDLPEDKPKRPCLDYHIGLCLAPCMGYQSRDSYGSMIAEILEVLGGDTRKAKKKVKGLMDRAVGDLKFEVADKFKDVLVGLEVIAQKQRVEKLKGGDLDAIGLVTEGNRGVVIVLRIRKGVLISRSVYVMDIALGATDEVILGKFAANYYLRKNFVEALGPPKQILVPSKPIDTKLIEEAVGDTQEKTIQFVVPQRGANRKLIELARENAEHVASGGISEERPFRKPQEQLLEDVRSSLKLKVLPRLMACVDISHHHGRETVGSMVVFQDAEPKKSEYRKMKIKGIKGNDDYRSMGEVVRRYFTRKIAEEQPLPDLLVLDGGKGQLSTVTNELQALGLEDLQVLSIAKKQEELFINGREGPLLLDKKDPVLKLFQRIRDEAHRFALTYSKKLRAKNLIDSELSRIEGVGITRQVALLKQFGSVKRIREATSEEIAEVSGISGTLANRISNYLGGSKVQ